MYNYHIYQISSFVLIIEKINNYMHVILYAKYTIYIQLIKVPDIRYIRIFLSNKIKGFNEKIQLRAYIEKTKHLKIREPKIDDLNGKFYYSKKMVINYSKDFNAQKIYNFILFWMLNINDILD